VGGCLVHIIYTRGDLQNMVRSIGMLLDQMKQLNEDTALRAPDRCEGVLNDGLQLFQHAVGTETEQDKIAMFWNVRSVTDVQQYLHITTGVSEYLYFLAGQTGGRAEIFYELCYRVSEQKARSCLISAWEKEKGELTGGFNKDMINRLKGRASLCKNFIDSCDVSQKETLFGLKHMFFVLELVSDVEPNDFYHICHAVNRGRAESTRHENEGLWKEYSYETNNYKQVKQHLLRQFVLDCTPEEIQKIFDQMIVKRKWRTYMLTAWKHRMVLAEEVRNLYFGVV
jgi:hypothetical protein